MNDPAALPVTAGAAASPGGIPAEDVVAFLETRAFGGDGAERRIDTHAASIFLTRDRAWKLKRPVRFGYLDFTTPERRRLALDAELRLNRRTAPDLYIGLHRVTMEPDRRLAIDGGGETIDWLLEMRRFADDALLDDRVRGGGLEAGLLDRLAERIWTFHAAAAVAEEGRGAARLARVIDGNAASLAAFPDLFPAAAVSALPRDQRKRLETLAGALDARAARGRVRHCHGDLHLANIAVIGGEPTPFDCLEFDAELATTDLLYDLAFLLMDLWHRGLHGEANRLFNRYLDLSGDDEDGVAAMPLFLSVRATVRAHVSAARAARGGKPEDRQIARSYLDLARRFLIAAPPRLIAIGGRSGTGKTALARLLAPEIGAPPGARILRSDVLRKRHAGLPPEVALPKEDYSARRSAEIYDLLGTLAGDLLSAGSSVIADAAFLSPAQRRAIEAVGSRGEAWFAGLWLETSESRRLRRVQVRGPDASDADATVVRGQSRRPTGAIHPWHRIRAGADVERVAQAARRILSSVRQKDG